MSLFHSIMYPITDITDPAQVDHIPQAIAGPWVNEILVTIRFEPKIEFHEIGSLAQFIYAALLWKASDWKTPSVGTEPTSKMDAFSAWESYFRKNLQEHILRYDE